jgi:pantoate--beta-alanine ligase
LLFVIPAVARTPEELREAVDRWRLEQLTVALVPTMGNLHEGHLDLVRAAATHAARVIVSIFVNPLQFGPGEDFAAYPRTFTEDLRRLADSPCDVVFVPAEEAMYPHGRDGLTSIEVPDLSDQLCGLARPGHFRGVATVVAKLFNLAQPDVAVFGEKDFQQLVIIRRLAADLSYPVKVVGVPTRREPDGLALSSRNRYLGAAERPLAPALYGALRRAAGELAAGRRDFVALQQEGMENLRSAGLEPEYFEIRGHDLAPPGAGDEQLVVLAAARLGRARLIDNVTVGAQAAPGLKSPCGAPHRDRTPHGVEGSNR